ncbi:hypothetical protein JHK82_012479 [Glycine max]|nr:hypothetical protein JHK82_012479 [Glycine max]
MLLFFSPSHPPLLPNKAPNFAHHFYSKSQKEVIFEVVKRTSTLWDFKFQVEHCEILRVRETKFGIHFGYIAQVSNADEAKHKLKVEIS